MPMPTELTEIDAPLASELLQRWVDTRLRVRQVRKMHGGSMNEVFHFILEDSSIPDSMQSAWIDSIGHEGEPRGIVAKVNPDPKASNARREYESLAFYQSHGQFPVPTPLAVIRDDSALGGSALLMTKVPGVLLSKANLTKRGVDYFNRQLAGYLIELHSHTRPSFGSALQPAGPADWLESFEPTIRQEFLNVRDQLSSHVRPTIDRILERLDHWVPRDPTPTLVHGDLWKNNVLVDDAHPDQPRITAFIDSEATYCDPVYELAYLRVFKTANARFFKDYEARYPRPDDFERRCHIYWLNTMLAHVDVFGQAYVRACEQTAAQLQEMV